jgi:hypothetical protein
LDIGDDARPAARDKAPGWAADLTKASPARRAAIALRDLWCTLVRGTPEQVYERRILQRIAKGDLRDTLGVEVRDEAVTRARGERWAATLVQLGLRPEHLCVEYGCGSLWCAEPIIRHLQPARFVGLDITDRFYEFGRQRLGSLLAEKQVRLDVISERTLREVAALKPDLVYSRKVIHHVPRRGLPRYVRNLAALLNPRTMLVIENTPQTAPDGTIKGLRYDAEDIQPLLPPGWQCRQEPFGLLVTFQGAPAGTDKSAHA